jgi:hypothetical protein
MKVYISGPITDIPDENREAFSQAAATIALLKHEPVNPHDVCADIYEIPRLENESEDAYKKRKWRIYMRKNIKALVECDAIHRLPGYEKSKGSKLEIHIAKELGFTEVDL